MNIVKPADKVVVGDKMGDDFVWLIDTSVPGTVALWTTSTGPKADFIFNHADPVMVSI